MYICIDVYFYHKIQLQSRVHSIHIGPKISGLGARQKQWIQVFLMFLGIIPGMDMKWNAPWITINDTGKKEDDEQYH